MAGRVAPVGWGDSLRLVRVRVRVVKMRVG